MGVEAAAFDDFPMGGAGANQRPHSGWGIGRGICGPELWVPIRCRGPLGGGLCGGWGSTEGSGWSNGTGG